MATQHASSSASSSLNGHLNNIDRSIASSLAVLAFPALLIIFHQLNVFILPDLFLTHFFIFGILYLSVYYYLYVVQRPRLFLGEGKFRHLLTKNCPSIREYFWPTPWFLSSHMSSIMAHIIRQKFLAVSKHSKEFVHLSDGGELALHWIDPKSEIQENAPIALFLPGVHGNSDTAYLRFMIRDANRLGFRCVVYHNRGLGGATLKTPRLFCGANVEDLRESLEHIKCKYPDSHILGVGCSLGGLHVTKYLIEYGEQSLIDFAMTISIPWDSFITSSNMEASQLNLLMNRFLVTKSLELVNQARHLFEELEYLDMDDVFASRTHKELDERFTSKIFGFKDVNHHYTEQSIPGKLHHIKVPLLSLSSSNDHFSPLDALPTEECKKLENVALIVTSYGGHIGFMDGIIPKPPYLMDHIFCQYASTVFPILEKKSSKSVQNGNRLL